MNGDEIMQTGGGISMGRHVTVNRLEIPKMTRSALNNTYKCQASNTKLVPPAERSIRVDMLLKPLSAALSSKPKQLISNQEYMVACNVEGSVPETDIKWMQNNRPFTKGKIKIINNSSMVSSVLSFRPHPDDDGTILKCEGSNPRLQNSVLEDSVIMNVLYPPQVTLSLGSTLNPDDIKEGDDVYFECHIKANPREHRITWSHDGLPVTQNVTSGVIISTRSLVLQRVGRFHSGSYACAAANDRGETQSDPVVLKIHSHRITSKPDSKTQCLSRPDSGTDDFNLRVVKDGGVSSGKGYHRQQ
uniref:Ig-like domain-containing protein n=1 Tax=Anopheles culicifacies TaxID=139723 RepID=A0A182M1H7_9DIPT